MVLDAVTSTLSEAFVGEFSLQELDGFPYDEWIKRKGEYEEQERWFTGDALDDQPELARSGTAADLYPMRINPIMSTVLKHAFILFGEVEDDGRPLVWPKLMPGTESQKPFAEEAEEALNVLWWENAARSMMISNAILSQIYGGCIFKAAYAPWESWRSIPIKIEAINPKNFIGYPDGGDPFRLSEAWFLRKVNGREARRWGLSGADLKDSYWYVEHWTQDSFECLIDGKPAVKMTANGAKVLGGENPYGFVPAVYIPHIRIVEFYGFNAFDHLKGYVKEMNRVMGDYGDAVNDDAHPTIAIRDVQGRIQMKRINNWLEVVDLGSSPNITGQERPPDMFEVRTPRASIAMNDLYDQVYSQYRRDAFIPAVADGEDEGSQRSALTLNTRFWPLTSHSGMERYYWTSGMDAFQPMLLKMMTIIKNAPLTKQHLGMRMKQKWASMLPRDREADVDEWVNRRIQGLGSIEHLLEQLGDVDDIPEERDRILKDIEDVARIEAEEAAKAVKKYPPPIQNTFGQNQPKKPSSSQPSGGAK